MHDNSVLRVGIGSLGTVGYAVAARLDQGIRGLRLAAVSARDLKRAEKRTSRFSGPVKALPLEKLAEICDVVVECAPAGVFRQLAEPAVRAGRIFVPISVGALIEHWSLVELAETSGARIIVPSGALLGLDAVRAAGEGRIDSVRMVTRKPPRGLAGAPYLETHDIDVSNLNAPLKVFEGTAREGAAGFPANVNVAAALGLAGIGPDDTRLEIWADPSVSRNTHHITVEADSARFELCIENVPTEENPRTGRLVAHSVVATLRRLTSALTVGT
ncbi:MAG TPA: aspartate dehydrogenase [Gammaproteobacteria bacterium]|nr:aspartate dehydrogenase [Gammaproteobacteria bacterium]